MDRNVRLATLPQPRVASSRGRSMIVVIGIDHHAAWPRLHNAVNDARGAARLFAQLGFTEVTAPLLDGAATGEAMRRLITADLAQLDADDSLVVFFAGHGHTDTAVFDDVAVKTGYLIPADGEDAGGHGEATWLRLDSWLSDIARLPPRHILVMIDACHSGVALSALHKWRGDVAAAGGLDALQARRSRCIITSALDDQRAMDGGPYPGHSLFTGCLIEGLSGGLGDGGRRVATGRELGEYLQRRVRSYPHTAQTPDFGAFELDDRGDIVVPILGAEAAPGAPAPSRMRRVSTDSSFAWQPHASPRRSRRRWWMTAAGIAGIAGASIAIGSGGSGDRDVRGPFARPDVRDVSLETLPIEIKGVVHQPQALLEAQVPYIALPPGDSPTDLVAAQRARIARTTDPARKRAQAIVLAALLYRQHHHYSIDIRAPELTEARRILRDAVQQVGVRKVDDTVLRLLGACDVLVQDYPASEQTWQALVDRNPAGRDAAYQRAWLAYAQLRQHKPAAALATVAGQPLDDSPELAYVTAWARWLTGDDPGAWQAITTAARHWNRGWDTDCVGRHACLVPLVGTSYQPLPGEVRWLAGLADIPFDQADAVQAVFAPAQGSLYHRGIRFEQLRDLGVRYGATGRWTSAIAALDRAVALLDDNGPAARIELRTAQAEFAVRLDTPELAAKYAGDAIDAFPLCDAIAPDRAPGRAVAEDADDSDRLQQAADAQQWDRERRAVCVQAKVHAVRRLHTLARMFYGLHQIAGDAYNGQLAHDLYAMTIPLLDNGATRARAQAEMTALQTAHADPTTGSGGHDGAAFRELLVRHNEEVAACYEVRLGASPALAGTIGLGLELDATGAITGVTTAPPAGAADLPAVAGCIADQARRWRLPGQGVPGHTHIALRYALSVKAAQE